MNEKITTDDIIQLINYYYKNGGEIKDKKYLRGNQIKTEWISIIRALDQWNVSDTKKKNSI